MGFLPRCRTDLVYLIAYYMNDKGIVTILRTNSYPLGIKMIPAPLINMETQIISFLQNNAATPLKNEDIFVYGEFFEPSKDTYAQSATFYLAKCHQPLKWHDDSYFAENFMTAIKNAPATRERATYLKAFQIIGGMHAEIFKAVEDVFAPPKA